MSRYYVEKIRESLEQRQRSNPQYSLRAYARDLGLDSSSLSKIMLGKRAIPARASLAIVEELQLDPIEKTLFIESIHKPKTKIDAIDIDDEEDLRFILDESYAKVIAEWEHYAVLSLSEITGFRVSASDVSERLGVSFERAEEVLDNLLVCGLLQEDTDGKLTKAHPDIRTTEDVTSRALRASHLEALEMGKKKLEEIDVELRDFSSVTLAVDLSKIMEVKTIIREFRQKVTALLKDGEKSEVFQLAIQFYPLSKIKKNGE